MSGTDARLARAAVDTLLRLDSRRLWERGPAGSLVLVEVPDWEGSIAACPMGHDGESFGLALYPGGIDAVDVVAARRGDDEAFERIDVVFAIVDRLQGIRRDWRGLLETARWRGRRDALAPHVVVKRAGRAPRNPRRRETKMVLFVAAALLKADDADRLSFCPAAGLDGFQVLRLSGKPRDPAIEYDRTGPEAPARKPDEAPAVPDFDPALPRVAREWVVALVSMGPAIRGDDRDAHVLAVADGESGRVIGQEVVLGEGPAEAAELFVRFVREQDGLADHVAFDSRALSSLLAAPLGAAGVGCTYHPEHPELQHLRAALDRLGAGARTGEAWEVPVRELVRLALDKAERMGRLNDRAFKRFFGDAELGRQLVEEEGDWFDMWVATWYRPRRDSKTVLEAVLERRRLPEDVRAWGEALRDSRPTFFRIESSDARGAVLLDVASGRSSTVNSPILADAGEGMLVSGVVVRPDGQLRFLPAGPVLSPFEQGPAFAFLEREGIEPTGAGLLRNPHWVGRLRAWQSEDRGAARAPRLVNTDGEDLCPHVADFEVADAPALEQRLREHPDFGWDEAPGRFSWLAPESEGLQPGRKILAGFEFVGDHLTAEVNSAERLDRLHELLASLGEVRLVGARATPIDVAGGAGQPPVPLDDLPSVDEPEPVTAMPPEVRAAVMRTLREMNRRWVDTSVPALDGLTPRQACRTPEGRRKVLMMVRSFPKPNPDITAEEHAAMRAETLAELGLEDGGEASPPA